MTRRIVALLRFSGNIKISLEQVDEEDFEEGVAMKADLCTAKEGVFEPKNIKQIIEKILTCDRVTGVSKTSEEIYGERTGG